MKLRVSYFRDTDTLPLWNGEPASEADDVAENFIVDYAAAGDAVGFTLEPAAELLLPLLNAAARAKAPEGKRAAEPGKEPGTQPQPIDPQRADS